MDIPEQAMNLGLSLAREINRSLESGDPNATTTAVIITDGMGEPIECCTLIKGYVRFDHQTGEASTTLSPQGKRPSITDLNAEPHTHPRHASHTIIDDAC